MFKKLKFALYLLGAVIITLGLSISLQSLLAAWTAPAASAPSGNVYPPINEGSAIQTKLGGLGIGGNFTVMGTAGAAITLWTNLTRTSQKILHIGNTGTGVNDGYFQLSDNGTVKVNIAANNSRGGDTYFNGGGNVGIGTADFAGVTGSGNLKVAGKIYGDGSNLTGVSASSVAWINVSSKPTTISGFGITDAVTTGNIGSYADITADTIADDGIISTGETNFTNQVLYTTSGPTFNTVRGATYVTANNLGEAYVGAGGMNANYYHSNTNDSWFAYPGNNYNYFRGTTYAFSGPWYDESNSGYYVDPASTSNFNALVGNEIYANSWFRNNGARVGLYSQTYGTHLYWDSASYLDLSTNNGMRFRSTSAFDSALAGYVYHDANGFGLLSSDGNWRVRTKPGYQELYGITYFPGSGIWNSSGNVGIGATNPSSKLSVGGNGNSSYGIYSTGSTYGIYSAGSTYGIYSTGTNGWGVVGIGMSGVYGSATNASGWSGYFTGGKGVYVSGNVQITGTVDFVPKIYTSMVYSSGHFNATASCGVGGYALGGGCDDSSTSNTALVRNYPYGSSAWLCRSRDISVSTSRYLTAYVICTK